MSFESALVVLVPEAESLIKCFRDQFDPSAVVGVPAHVTILYPFKPPDELTVDVLATLQDLVSSLPSFNVSFQKIQEFPDMLYLAPMPAEPFQHLTEIIVGTYPETPPYGGAFTEILPHLTVALASDSQRLDEIAAKFREVAGKELPIHARVNTVSLLDNSNGCWKVRAKFSLGSDRIGGSFTMLHNRQEVIQRVKQEFEILDHLVANLTDEQWHRLLPRSESKDPWTVKDALAHIAHWKADVARSARRQRRPAEERGLNTTQGNHLVYLRWHDRSPQEVLAWHRQVQQDVLEALQQAPEKWFSGRERGPDWPGDLVGHSAEHRLKDIELALKKA